MHEFINIDNIEKKLRIELNVDDKLRFNVLRYSTVHRLIINEFAYMNKNGFMIAVGTVIPAPKNMWEYFDSVGAANGFERSQRNPKRFWSSSRLSDCRFRLSFRLISKT